MYKINFQKPIHIHFIGIGGINEGGGGGNFKVVIAVNTGWQRFFLKKASLYQDPMQKNHL